MRSVFRFEGAVRAAIHEFKYHSLKALAGPLALPLAGYLKSKPLPVEVLVPVPLHFHRLKERGYNQSALLARETGRLTSLPVIEDSLRRVKDSPRQARSASVAERLRNVAGAFSCAGSALAGKRALLIDDVCTSGATLEACAAAVKGAGAASVWGLTVAREVSA